MKIEKIDIKQDLEQKNSIVSILDDGGNCVNRFVLPSLIGASAVSDDKKKAIISTLMPDNTIYCYDIEQNQLIWKYKNHSHKLALGIKFADNLIEIITGKSIAGSQGEYRLQLDGTLEKECQNQIESISKIKELSLEESIPGIINYLSSNYRTIRLGSIAVLQSLSYDKKITKYLPLLVKEIPSLLNSQDSDVFDLTWKLIRRIISKDPKLIDPILSDILTRIKTIKSEYGNPSLFYIQELCSANPDWIKTEISYVEKTIEKSKDGYEKRNAQDILELYHRKTKKIPNYQFPISGHKLELNFKEYKNKTKDHLISFSEDEIVARIGWTKPSKIFRLDSELKKKWKIEIPGRVRKIKSDSDGSVISESTFTKNDELGSIFGSDSVNPEKDGRFVSSIFIIDNSGRIVIKLEKIIDFLSVEGISSEKVLIWKDSGLILQCLNRNTGEKLWEKSFFDSLHDKYSMRVIRYYENFDKCLVVRMSNKQKDPVIPSIILVLDGSGNILSEFEDKVPYNEPSEDLNPTSVESGGIRISIRLPPPYYPIYHALITPDGNHIITADYIGQVSSWSLDGELEWIFECKNKVNLGMSITSDGLISALCENGDFFLIENGKKIMHAILKIDFRKSYQVFSTEKYAGLSYDKKIMFFDREGLVLEKEFPDKIREVVYNSPQKLLAISASCIFLTTI